MFVRRIVFGFLNINKVKYQTSREAVNAVQRRVKPSKVGHAGTLDPLATGVLVIGVGPATRLTQYVQRIPKTYIADFRLGVESDTEDVAGQIKTVPDAPVVSERELVAVLPEFFGEIQQMPPTFSALMVQGERAYSLARKGVAVELKSRTIEIHHLQLIWFKYPDFQLEIRCGSGTYVRSLGRDIGRRLSSGAIMTKLVRTAIGGFLLPDSLPSDSITSEAIARHLIPPQFQLGDLKRVNVSDDQLERFANGCAWIPDREIDDEEVAAVDASDRLLAILKKRTVNRFTPNINFSNYWLKQARMD
jgi:tRNA pseudouridine55 synthase